MAPHRRRLNPNNVHFDPALAERYKALSRREKDMLWATDQLMAAHQLAAQQQAAAAAAGGSGPPAVEAMSMLNRVSEGSGVEAEAAALRAVVALQDRGAAVDSNAQPLPPAPPAH